MPIRKYPLPGGESILISVEWCKCSENERRGPAGGVCWCGGAIPSEEEKVIEKSVRSEDLIEIVLET